MSRKAKCQHLLEKSVHAALSAIEIYNKPDFKYREESFSILMVNAWELLLKARILQRNKNKLESIYIVDPNKTRKDGTPYKKAKFKTSRSGNYLTIDVTNAMKELKLPERLRENLGLLIEIRDNAIHFMNDSKLFEKKFLEIGTSSLKSYVNMVNKWFDYDLSQYNFYLMPISFFHNHETLRRLHASGSISDDQIQGSFFYKCFKQKFYDPRTTGHQSLPHLERCLGCHLQISKHLHHIQDVYIVEHQSCGACKEYLNEDKLAGDEVACIANSRKPSGLRKFLF